MIRPASIARVTAVAAAVIVLATACTHSAARPDTTALRTTAPSGAQVCGFVSSASVVTALGKKIKSSSGAPNYATDGTTNADGGPALVAANCGVSIGEATANSGNNFSVDVELIGARNDLDTHTASVAKYGNPPERLPAKLGIGYGEPTKTLNDDAKARAGVAEALWGNYRVTVYIDDAAAGRDPAKDALAILQQVATTLKLPTKASVALPTPTPSPS